MSICMEKCYFPLKLPKSGFVCKMSNSEKSLVLACCITNMDYTSKMGQNGLGYPILPKEQKHVTMQP